MNYPQPKQPPSKLTPFSYDIGPFPIANGFIITEESLKVAQNSHDRVVITPRSFDKDGNIEKMGSIS